jgi:hypothetical protein
MVIREILLFSCTGVLIGFPAALIGAHLVAHSKMRTCSQWFYIMSPVLILYQWAWLCRSGLRHHGYRLFTGAVRITVEPGIAFREEWLELIACCRRL